MFKLDQQTLSDIHALDWNSASLLRFFDSAGTIGGRDMLYEYFRHPLDKVTEINERQQAIQYLSAVDALDTLFDKFMMSDLERYLAQSNKLYSDSVFTHYVDKLATNFWTLRSQQEDLLIRQSIKEIAQILVRLSSFFLEVKDHQQATGALHGLADSFYAVVADMDMGELENIASGKLSASLRIRYDHLFRSIKQQEIQDVFRLVYTLDAFRAVARTLGTSNLCFPSFQPEGDTLVRIDGLYNLALEHPVTNDLIVKKGQNIVFLTGANMTGKSTFLKSVGACIALAHMGFPVPAERMELPCYSGLITSINVSDSLASGQSHFLSEVHRVKLVAQAVGRKQRVAVMFDELFKGTNYDDAFEATLLLVQHLKNDEESLFFLSTHITELTQVLAENKQISFQSMETRTDEDAGILFTYRLRHGVADQKLGMWLLRREGVFESFGSCPN